MISRSLAKDSVASRPALSRTAGFLALLVVTAVVMGIPLPANVHAVDPILIVQVGDTSGPAGMQNSVISVSMSNDPFSHDTVAAFVLNLKLDQFDIMEFKTDTQTVHDTTWWRCTHYTTGVCDDSIAIHPDSTQPGDIRHIKDTLITIGSLDRTGTLIQNWEYVSTRSLSGTGHDIQVTAIANILPYNPTDPKGILPGQSGKLFKLLGDIFNIPDTMTDRDCVISMDPAYLEKALFSRPGGTAIGVYNETIPNGDTACYHCFQWVGNSCLDTARVSLHGGLSCDVGMTIGPLIKARLDTNLVKLWPGSLTVLQSCCLVGATSWRGNVDQAGPALPALADLSKLISYLKNQPGHYVIPCNAQANVDALPTSSSNPGLADLSKLISYLKGGTWVLLHCP